MPGGGGADGIQVQVPWDTGAVVQKIKGHGGRGTRPCPLQLVNDVATGTGLGGQSGGMCGDTRCFMTERVENGKNEKDATRGPPGVIIERG